MRGVGMVVGEGAVDRAEQLDHLAADRAEQRRRVRPRHPVAAVDRDLHRARQTNVADDPVDIALRKRLFAQTAALCGIDLGQPALDLLRQALDRVAVDGLAAHHHLQTVVVRRVVAAGDGDARSGAELVGAVVDHRRGHHADVDHAHAGRTEPVRQFGGQRRSGQAPVAADDGFGTARGAHAVAEREPDGAHRFAGERRVDDAADVIGLEDGGVDGVHGRCCSGGSDGSGGFAGPGHSGGFGRSGCSRCDVRPPRRALSSVSGIVSSKGRPRRDEIEARADSAIR